jgi:alpha-tubulin suppressor-like RCC1 family protein
MRRLLSLTLLVLTAGTGVVTAPVAAQPAPEAALTGITRLEAGDDHTCAVTTSREVRCWGHGGWRQLGNGLTSSPGIPNAVLNTAGTSPLTGITQVSAGGAYTCARTATGQARCWGYNQDGQLGVGDQAVHTFPVIVKGVGGTGRLSGVTQVSAGWNHACARVGGGQVRCWGTNNKGQIGDDSMSLRTTPTTVLAPTGTGALTGATQLTSGIYFNCARLSTGRVACWGSNVGNQLGDGSDDDRDRPVYVRNSANTGPLTGVRQVAAGGYFACALLTNGQARCWGSVPSGASALPAGVLNANGSGPLTGITSISAGFSHVCFRLETGRVRCLGANGVGELGDLTTSYRNNPVLMTNTAGTAPATGVTAVTAGEHHTCARLNTGQLMCTGANDVGQLGAGPGPNTARPIGVRRN